MRFTIFHHRVECVSAGCFVTSTSAQGGIEESFVPRSQLVVPLIVAIIIAMLIWRAVRRRRPRPGR